MLNAYLDAAAIRAATFIRHVEIHDTLGSTNDRAAELARDTNIELPALVAARNQTAGRGRDKNIWWSADGALTFSILLDPAAFGITTANWPQLSLATAVAVCDALAHESNPQSAIPNPQLSRLAIKWPNDVMLDGAKVGGILIESPGGASPAKDRLIIGIGVNINNSWHNQTATRGLAQQGTPSPNVIALFDTTSRSHNLQHVLCETLRALATRISQLTTRDPQLPAAWQQLCWLTEQTIEVQSNGKVIDGVCLGIAGDGTLLVQDIFGKHNISSGSVRVR
jgi:BirA family biotin operon repressor/biotin-[acetyl-CoA-carboxylase] ligase